MRGKYKGDFQYHELPLLNILPLVVSPDQALTLATPFASTGEGSSGHADLGSVDEPVSGVSCNDRLSQTPKDETTKEARISGSRAPTKWQTTRMDSPLVVDG